VTEPTPARAGHAMVFDSIRDRFVIVGGSIGDTTEY